MSSVRFYLCLRSHTTEFFDYDDRMHVASVTHSEIRITIEVLIDMVNRLDDGELTPRPILAEAGFSRAVDASEASIQRLRSRVVALAPLVQGLAHLDIETAFAKVNEELTELPIAPSIVDHGGVGPHIHWTPSTATFDDQVIADMVMALAQELADSGTIRFGRCSAEGCDRLFFDGTRNRSRRFCSDPRCASRTHTADHRARQRSG